MSSRLGVRKGQSIELKISFVDGSEGEFVDPSPLAVSVSIYPHGYDPREGDYDANAWVLNATLTSGGTGSEADPANLVLHPSVGHFSYTFTVPSDAEEGTAYDNWVAIVDGESLDTTSTYTIIEGGVVGETQLFTNNAVYVTISSTLASEDGNTLGDNYEFYFTTTYSPLYAPSKRLRLELGSLISDIPEDTINLALFEASLEADALTFGTPSFSTTNESRFFEFARKQYVICTAEMILLNALNGSSGATGGGKTKQLADLSVSYKDSGIGSVERMLDKALKCRIKWESNLTSAGVLGPGTSQKPSMAIKGINDYDRPYIGRDWETTNSYDADLQVPAANTSVLRAGLRRWQRTYNSRWNSRFSSFVDSDEE